MISKKIILSGSFGVGKTSLFNRFLYNKFSEKYLTTIGVKVDKKVVVVDGKQVSLLVWDIAGEVAQDKVPISYFLGASGVIYVFDSTREATYNNIESDIAYLKKLAPNCVIKVVGNKKDLLEEGAIEQLRETINVNVDLFTSAKNGDNVEELFEEITKGLLEKL